MLDKSVIVIEASVLLCIEQRGIGYAIVLIIDESNRGSRASPRSHNGDRLIAYFARMRVKRVGAS